MKAQRLRQAILCAAGALLGASSAAAQALPAFPGAEGAGAMATGGRPNSIGGVVYHVTNLQADPNGETPGSLRYGLKTENWWQVREDWLFPYPFAHVPDSYDVVPRIIVFDVGGTIDIGEVDMSPINVTIAGQTAPGGITLYGGEFNPGHDDTWDEGTPPKVNNLVLRNFAVRTHDPAEKDGLWLAASNSIADHVSLSWYTDEGVSITDSARDVTVQHSIIGPGWNNPDGDGSQLEGKTPGAHISVHHNLYVHNDARVPRLGEKEGPGVEVDFRNNVVYNWDDNNAGYSTSDEPSFSNFVNNYYIGGADNGSSDVIFQTGNGVTRIYQSGNLLDRNRNGAADGQDLGWAPFTGPEIQQPAPYDVPHGVTQTSAEALNTVLAHSGARWWDRDFLDERVIDQVQTFGDGPRSETGGVLSDVPSSDVDAVTGAPMQTRPAGWDSDSDGMPDHWEAERGLNPNSPSDTPDWNADDDADGYVNLEEYVNDIAAWPAPYDIHWAGGDARYAEITNWSITRDAPDEAATTTNWQPSRFDKAVIDAGAVTVDAPGQHAGAIVLGSEAGADAALNVTGGWLTVSDEEHGPGDGAVVIGGDPTATATLNLTGGRLEAGRLARGAGGSFNFTGGELAAGVVDFELVNDGGVLALGTGLGETSVAGDVTLNGGAMAIELASATEHGLLTVEGSLSLGGDLVVSLVNGYAPAAGSWTIATASSVTGHFNAITPGFAVEQQGEDLVLSVAATLPGDFNMDGVVDAADYTVWRDGLGATHTAAQFQEWRENYGATLGSAGAVQNVPEPGALWMLLIAVASRAVGRLPSSRSR